jgi:DNA polymerase III epsilon subunit-like protein
MNKTRIKQLFFSFILLLSFSSFMYLNVESTKLQSLNSSKISVEELIDDTGHDAMADFPIVRLLIDILKGAS